MLNTVTEETLVVMEKHSGSFMRALAATLRVADPMNINRVLAAFPEIELHYGTHSRFQVNKQPASFD